MIFLCFIRLSLSAEFVKSTKISYQLEIVYWWEKFSFIQTFFTDLFKKTLIILNTGSREVLLSPNNNWRFIFFDACNVLIYQITNVNHVACYHIFFQHTKSSSFCKFAALRKFNAPGQQISESSIVGIICEITVSYRCWKIEGGSKNITYAPGTQ